MTPAPVDVTRMVAVAQAALDDVSNRLEAAGLVVTRRASVLGNVDGRPALQSLATVDSYRVSVYAEPVLQDGRYATGMVTVTVSGLAAGGLGARRSRTYGERAGKGIDTAAIAALLLEEVRARRAEAERQAARERVWSHNQPAAQALVAEFSLPAYHPVAVRPSQDSEGRVVLKIDVQAALTPEAARKALEALRAAGLLKDRP